MTPKEKENYIRNFTLLSLLETGLLQKGWGFQWSSAKRIAGQCLYKRKLIRISKVLLHAMPLDENKDTVLHEIAHALTPGDGHGHKWQATARELGAKPERCFHSTVVDKSKINYKYTAVCMNCGKKTNFSRRWKYTKSCGKCHPGVFNPAYELRVIENY